MAIVILTLHIDARADAETIATAVKNKFATQLDNIKIKSAELQVHDNVHEVIKAPQ